MKKIFKKAAGNIKTNLECKETRIVGVLCVAVIAFGITGLVLSPFIK